MSENITNAIVLPNIYRLYKLDIPTKFLINPLFEIFDFILGFASEEYKHGKGTGNFKPTWEVDGRSIAWVKKMKHDHPNARFIISIGGVGSEFPFNPNEKEDWTKNAVKSIKDIIYLYHDALKNDIIDGIDIHYDVIKTTDFDFSFYIGELIRKLKNDNDLSISVVSIAPTKQVESYYHKLYLDNKDSIDLVDYQFYNQKFSSIEEVVELYEKLVVDYTPAKVLPGISIPFDYILNEGIKYLINKKLTSGMFVWNGKKNSDADDSFTIDKILQGL